jgi:hypothetical protein
MAHCTPNTLTVCRQGYFTPNTASGKGAKSTAGKLSNGSHAGSKTTRHDNSASTTYSGVTVSAFTLLPFHPTNDVVCWSRLLDSKRHQCKMPSALDCDRELALMSGAVSRDTAWQNFAAFGHEIP